MALGALSAGFQGLMESVLSLLPEGETEGFPDTPMFGDEAWKRHFGIDVDSTPIPDELTALLEEKCPFFEDKTVRETHFAILIPKKLSLKNFYERVNKRPAPPFVDMQTGELCENKWILVLKKPAPHTLLVGSFREQEDVVKESGYRSPSLFEAGVVASCFTVLGLNLWAAHGRFTRTTHIESSWPVSIRKDSGSMFSVELFDAYFADNGIAAVKDFNKPSV